MQRRTPDEKFLIQLYKIAQSKGGLHNIVSIKAVITPLGQKETMGKTMVKHLAQANFVKKHGEEAVSLTDHGIRFVENELS